MYVILRCCDPQLQSIFSSYKCYSSFEIHEWNKKKKFTDGIHTFYEAFASFAHGGCNGINIQV